MSWIVGLCLSLRSVLDFQCSLPTSCSGAGVFPVNTESVKGSVTEGTAAENLLRCGGPLSPKRVVVESRSLRVFRRGFGSVSEIRSVVQTTRELINLKVFLCLQKEHEGLFPSEVNAESTALVCSSCHTTDGH